MDWSKINLSQLPSPCYVIDCDSLINNLKIMKRNCESVGIKPLLAVKGFPLALIFRDMAPYVHGISASSLFEAQLGVHMGKEIHIHTPAYRPDEIIDVLHCCDHVVFNSFTQWDLYRDLLNSSPKRPSVGLRINPEYSEVEIDKYNPCLPYSRFGITRETLFGRNLTGIDGFHLHVMCDHGAETFARVINNLVSKFEAVLPQLSWINFGGGQRLADKDYKIELLHDPISRLANDFDLDIYVEPCEAVVTGSGYLVSSVLDVIKNGKETAILDTSALCHMPDVLEMPYRPDIEFPSDGNHGNYRYIFAGVSCLAGDIIGEYGLDAPIKVGDKIIFSDMGAYTFAKENYFNGINHPAIVLYDQLNGFRVVKQFDYKDYEHQYLM